MTKSWDDVLPDKKGCEGCPVSGKSICAGCSQQERTALEQLHRYKSFNASEFIVHQGQALAFVANVVSGVIYIAQTLEDGRRQIEGLLFPGDFIGHHQRAQNEFDFVAVTPVRLCVFDRSSFLQLMDGAPDLSRQLLNKAQDERDAARSWMLLLGRKTARERIATLILMLAQIDHLDTGADPIAPVTFTMPLSQALIADYLGLTLETVNRQLAALKTEKMIHFQRPQQITILDVARLTKLSGPVS